MLTFLQKMFSKLAAMDPPTAAAAAAATTAFPPPSRNDTSQFIDSPRCMVGGHDEDSIDWGGAKLPPLSRSSESQASAAAPMKIRTATDIDNEWRMYYEVSSAMQLAGDRQARKEAELMRP
jgi:hypothetical protein